MYTSSIKEGGMRSNTLTVREMIVLGAVAVAGIACAWFVLANTQRAFPELHFPVQISRDVAIEQSDALLRSKAIDPSTFQRATILNRDEIAYTYLSQSFESSTASTYMQDRGVVQWLVRYFQPLAKEEYTVGYDPDGTLRSLNHTIAEDQPGARLPIDRAEQLARDYVASLHIPLQNYTLLEQQTVERPQRTDHTFTFEDTAYRALEATARIRVTVQGDQIGDYQSFLKIPESWTRDFETRRSRNNAAQLAAEILMTLLMVWASIVAIQYLRKYRTVAVFVPMMLLVAAISVGMIINQLPSIFFYFDTTQTLTSYLVPTLVFGAVLVALSYISVSSTAFLAGLHDARAWAERAWINVLPGINTKRGIHALLIGSSGGLLITAINIVIYLVGRSFGFWTPPNLTIDSTLSLTVPWLEPLFIGAIAAISEEFLFRQFAITVLRNRMKSTLLAVILSSVAWAFLHANYPVEPWYARGIEVSLIGFVLAGLYLRYGILASITAHYVANAFMTSLGLYFAHASIPVLLAAFTLTFLPAFISLWSFMQTRTHGFAPETPATLPLRPKAILRPSLIALPKWQLSTTAIMLFTALALVGSVILYAYRDEGYALPRYEINEQQAITRAKQALHERGVEASQYRVVATRYSDTQQLHGRSLEDAAFFQEYVKANNGSEAIAAHLARTYLAPPGYFVRFFNVLQREEYSVEVRQDGSIEAVQHDPSDEQPGKSLDEATALQIATQALAQHNTQPNLTLADAQSEQRDARLDWTFIWEAREPIFANAHLRYSILVLGDEPTGFVRYVKVPEDFQREQQQTPWFATVAQVGQGLLMLIAVGLGLWYAIRLFRTVPIPWRQTRMVPLVVCLLFLARSLNLSPSIFSYYDTTQPLALFLASELGITLLSAALSAALTWLLAALALAAWYEHFEGHQSVTVRTTITGLLVGTLVVIIAMARDALAGYVPLNILPVSGFSQILDILSSSLGASLLFLPLIVFAGLALHRAWSIKGVLLGTALFVITGTMTAAHTTEDVWNAIRDLLIAAPLAFLVIRYVFQTQLLSYFFFFVLYGSIPGMLALILQPELSLRAEGLIGITILSAASIYSFLRVRQTV